MSLFKKMYLIVVVVSYSKRNGSLEVLSFETLSDTYKVEQLTDMKREKDHIWSSFGNHLVGLMGGVKFRLK